MYFDILSGAFSQFQPGDETTHAQQARILLCDFGLMPYGWADGINAWVKQTKKQHKGNLFHGDLLLLQGIGADIVRVAQGLPFAFIKFDSKSWRYEQKLIANMAQYIKPGNLDLLERYERIEIIACGLSVVYAAFLLNQFPEEWFRTKTIRGIALGGTVSGADYTNGMNFELWQHMLDHLGEGQMEQYYLNLFNSPECYYNLRNSPIDLEQKSPRMNQSPLPKLTDYKKRLQECACAHLGEQYGKIATTICYQSARPLVFQKLKGIARSFMNMSSKMSTPGIMRLSADLCFMPIIPLGNLGRTRFDQCFKLQYAYLKDVMWPVANIKADAGPETEVRELDSPHFNCQQIIELLLNPNHPDWDAMS